MHCIKSGNCYHTSYTLFCSIGRNLLFLTKTTTRAQSSFNLAINIIRNQVKTNKKKKNLLSCQQSEEFTKIRVYRKRYQQ